MVFPRLGIYGWKEADENLALSGLLTGVSMMAAENSSRVKEVDLL